MLTRCIICIPKGDGIHVVYCHSDGYPEGVGKCLASFYNSFQLACGVVGLGDLSTLGDSVDSTYAYHRNRGDSWEDCQPLVYVNTEEVYETAKDSDANYIYMWDLLNSRWTVHDVKTNIGRSL